MKRKMQYVRDKIEKWSLKRELITENLNKEETDLKKKWLNTMWYDPQVDCAILFGIWPSGGLVCANKKHSTIRKWVVSHWTC